MPNRRASCPVVRAAGSALGEPGRTSRRIVPALRRDGDDVTYRECPGGHTVPPELAREAVERIARR
jgi:predicted esterase